VRQAANLWMVKKDLHHYGFKLGLRISRAGMIIAYPLLPTRPHDSQLLDDSA
jgi:hypothetical protein